MNLHVPHVRRSTQTFTFGLALAVLFLPVAITVAGGDDVQQQQPGDLPAAATLSAQLLGTSEARLGTCRDHHEACLIALQTAAAKLYMVQTAVASEPEATVAP